MNNAINNIRARITPECGRLASTVFALGIIQSVVLVAISILFLAVYLYYNADVKASSTSSTADELEKKKKKIKTMMIVSIVLEVVTVLASLWTVLTAGKIKDCVSLVSST
ncbi:Orf124 [Heliothis zea nudivirus]|uniref:11k virion structural protein n=2 Tax=Betanudivirus hezeae TaxID=3052000 RepID=G9I051_HZNV2|nr:Orf124 [Heliothis zea nudivirus]YP_004956773.1 orf25 gene product [Helicoverpa zea nudivirus 2]AAN04417.1 Orf124 [Heliothis zea nudivirus]AEW69574.1 11k virion structural protein [Helicoverpa zea nudivirus 2]WCZ68505.1 11k virion structural protein [Heliothis virescens nudivirus]